MLCDCILYNIGDRTTPGGAPEDPLPLQWFELHARAVRGQTRSGRRVDVLLPLGIWLRDGDVVFEDVASRIVVRVIPVDLLVIRPRSMSEAAVLAAELGNLHLPLEVTERELLTPNDGPAIGILLRHGLRPETTRRSFSPLRSLALTAPRVSSAVTVRRSTGVVQP